ncbi:iron ABC transporter permease [uncultured Ilyobacter sp.]|uniref:ABC transporter permease n=1 Tax=uncultured Ilyobacter sp. TaxID=544433 RepID=UPI002AA8A62E|nr:iron ABC transporter permease [uncultured Ilyobacter sp.]
MKIFKIEDGLIKMVLLGLILSFILLPISDSIPLLFTPNSSYLEVLISKGIIWEYLFNTLELVFKVGIFSILLGFTSSYLITMYEFKFKNIFKVLLTLPLAFPVYVGAYTYSSIFYTNKWLSYIFTNKIFMEGSVFIYGIFLYPYIYLACRSYLKNNLVEYIEASKTLGKSNFETFIKVIFPISWPAILGSTLFVIFETLSDFAVVEFYGVATISKVITDSWMGLGQKDTAAKVSIILIFILGAMIFVEKLIRRRKRYEGISNRKIKPEKPSKLQSFAIYIFLGIIVSLGFILPAYEMIKFSIAKSSYIEGINLFDITSNTLITLSIAIVFIIAIATIFASIVNQLKNGKKFFSTIAVMGYSIPSLILALAVYIFTLSLDNSIYNLFHIEWLVLMNTRTALIIALVIKFISVAFSNYSNTLDKINLNIFNASKILGHNFLGTFIRINLPLLKKPTKFVFILLFIDLIKELTLTYTLRPFNFKTLSTEIYRYAGNEMIEVAAIPSLVIVGVCSLMILYLELGGRNVKNRQP